MAVPSGVTIGEGDRATWSALRKNPWYSRHSAPDSYTRATWGRWLSIISIPEEVVPTLERLADALAGQDVKPAGYLVEEQQHGGIELIVGVIRHPDAGPLVLLGHGGVLAELVGRSVLRPWPLSRRDAQEMVAELPAQQLLDGARGAEPVDREAIVELLQAISAAGETPWDGTGGARMQPGARRTVRRGRPRCAPHPPAGGRGAPAPPATDFTRLFAPARSRSRARQRRRSRSATASVAYRAARGGPRAFTRSIPRRPRSTAYRRCEVSPRSPAASTTCSPAYPRPSSSIWSVLRGAARFVHVVSGGFAETGESGRALEQELGAAARTAGVRLLKPELHGHLRPARTAGLRAGAPLVAGGVSVLSQSGGLTGDILQAGHRAGLGFAHLASIGNAVDVTAPELLDWLVDDPALPDHRPVSGRLGGR